MRVPRFAKDEADLEQASRQAKSWTCPHCGRHETLNRHGKLRGWAQEAPDKQAVRGCRFFCSNRHRRPGCGRTFSVLLATVIVHATVRTQTLWRFLLARAGGGSVLAAWERARSTCSLEAAYRWWRRWRRGELRVRAWLQRQRAKSDEAAVLDALAARFGADDPIAAWQFAQQEPWPG